MRIKVRPQVRVQRIEIHQVVPCVTHKHPTVPFEILRRQFKRGLDVRRPHDTRIGTLTLVNPRGPLVHHVVVLGRNQHWALGQMDVVGEFRERERRSRHTTFQGRLQTDFTVPAPRNLLVVFDLWFGACIQ